MIMDARIEEILASLRRGITADGGIVEQLKPTEHGCIRIYLKETCAMCYVVLWTHRLRIERAINESYPQAKIVFVTNRNQGGNNAG
jgi:Fe-S cluster biogenesis protein NfuA